MDGILPPPPRCSWARYCRTTLFVKVECECLSWRGAQQWLRTWHGRDAAGRGESVRRRERRCCSVVCCGARVLCRLIAMGSSVTGVILPRTSLHAESAGCSRWALPAPLSLRELVRPELRTRLVPLRRTIDRDPLSRGRDRRRAYQYPRACFSTRPQIASHQWVRMKPAVRRASQWASRERDPEAACRYAIRSLDLTGETTSPVLISVATITLSPRSIRVKRIRSGCELHTCIAPARSASIPRDPPYHRCNTKYHSALNACI